MAKDAETRAANKALEEGIFIARCLKEAFTGKRGKAQMPVHLFSGGEEEQERREQKKKKDLNKNDLAKIENI